MKKKQKTKKRRRHTRTRAPSCSHTRNVVMETRRTTTQIRRRLRCSSCGHRSTEYAQLPPADEPRWKSRRDKYGF